MSGDSDFTPLVLEDARARTSASSASAPASSTSRLLVNACDEFIFYDSIVQTRSRRRKSDGQPDGLAAALDLLGQALDGLLRESPDPPLASVVKSAVLRKGPDFNESDLGFSSFARFLEAGQDAGIVRVVRDNKSGGYRVLAPDDDGRASGFQADDDDGGDWIDPYLPKGAGPWLSVLSGLRFEMMGAPTRLAVLEALVAVVSERSKRRKKTTVQFVREDVKKKIRRTHPELPNATIKALLDTLMSAGELIHRDGTAIRSGAAPFTLTKDAEALNESLVRVYLSHLRDEGCDLSDTATLAELMYGDADRRREIEETLAYLATEGEGDGDDLDLDLDDLLVPVDAAGPLDNGHATNGVNGHTGTPAGAPVDPLPAEPTLDAVLIASEEPRTALPTDEKPKRTRTRKPRAKADPADAASEAKPDAKSDEAEIPPEPASDLDAVLEASPEPEPPKRRRTRKPRAKAEAEPTTDAAEASADKPADEVEAEAAPKKRPSRRRKKEEPPAEDISDLDALLEPQPGPESA